MLQGFDSSFYLAAKLAVLQAENPGEWADRDSAYLESLLADSFGLTPEMHYSLYGYAEGLSPNAFFNHDEYRYAKAEAMVDMGQAASLASALTTLDTAWPGDLYLHYVQYGAGEGINPSNSFDESSYLEAKLSSLQTDPDTTGDWSGKTIDDLRTFLDSAGMTVITHYLNYGVTEGLTAFAVPADEQVNLSQSVSQLPHEGVSLPSGLSLDWVDTSEITTQPHSAIGQIRVTSGGTTSIGTGFLISPEHVLTCAHVLLDDNGNLDPGAVVTFSPGLNGETSAAAVYGWETAWVQHSFTSSLYALWPDDDIGIIKLEQPVSTNTGYLSLEPNVNLSLINTDLYSAGYPAADIDQDNPATAGQDFYQWEVSGTVDRYLLGNGALDLSDTMTVSAGASGSPVYYAQDETVYFTGVLAGVLGNDTVAAAIDTDTYNWILGIVQQDGYYIDYSIV